MKDAVSKTAKLFLDYCLENNVSTVYYGDLDSATRSTKQNNKGNKYVRQKLTQWNYGQIFDSIEDKVCKHDVKLIKIK
jgi:putative transposase